MIPNDYGGYSEKRVFPGFLVEIGFKTNPEDKLLTKRSYQKKIAEAITEGIWQYFRKQGGKLIPYLKQSSSLIRSAAIFHAMK